METALREQVLARAEALVNALATWAHDHPAADLEQREAVVLEQDRALLRDLLGQLAGADGPRTSVCPGCGVRSDRPVQRHRPRTVQTRCGPVHIARQLLESRGCGVSWRPLDGVLGLAPKQHTSTGVQRWEARLGGLMTFAEAAHLLGELTGVARAWRWALKHCAPTLSRPGRYHATEHLWSLAAALHGEPRPTAHTITWQRRAESVLWKRGASALLGHLARLRPPTPEAVKQLATERGYFRTNAARMQYPVFRQPGLPIGSGAVESEAKRLVQLRLKRSGMRRSDLGARAVLNLRCHSLGGRSLNDLPLAS